MARRSTVSSGLAVADPVGARRIFNGTDRDTIIVTYSVQHEIALLTSARISDPPGTRPARFDDASVHSPPLGFLRHRTWRRPSSDHRAELLKGKLSIL